MKLKLKNTVEEIKHSTPIKRGAFTFQDGRPTRRLVMELMLPTQTAKLLLNQNSRLVCSANCTDPTDKCDNKSIRIELDDRNNIIPYSMINMYLNLGPENSARCLGPTDHFEQGRKPDLGILKTGNGTGKSAFR